MHCKPKVRVLIPLTGALLLAATAMTAAAQTPPQRDVESLLRSMTLAEKLSLLHGARDPEPLGQAGYVPGVPRLGIPPLRLTDGPAGIRISQPATALPAPVALAATFDPELARAYGGVLGAEGRALGQDVLLAPMVNIVRVPQAGRNFETLGEDPLLASRMVAEEVRGVQAVGLIATIKHYIANNQEAQRQSVSAQVDDRTLHEIYLPGFAAAVHAGAGSVMASYNRINGTYAAENRHVLTDILRDQLGFTGWVMSDWGATHSAAPALRAGLEMEMPGDRWFGDTLLAAVRSGEVKTSEVDEAVRRILRPLQAIGLLDHRLPPRPTLPVEADAAVARNIAIAGAVLLRNRGHALPLDQAALAQLLVVGPTAQQPLIGGGGSARVPPLRRPSPLDAIRARAGSSATVRYLPGIDLDGELVPSAVLTPAGTTGGHGLLRSSASGPAGTDSTLNFTGPTAIPPGADWTWTGQITAPETGVYELKLQTAAGRARLQLDGQSQGGRFLRGSLIPTAGGLSNSTIRVRLEAGVPRALTVTARAGADTPMHLRLAWTTPSSRAARIAEAVEAARSARAVVLFAFCEESEGADRANLALPEEQDSLIQAIAGAAAGPLVVVLNVGAPVLMPWVDDVDAILLTWYPGQEGASATAALLAGDAVPSGKLPVTFPLREEDTPVHQPERYPGVNGRETYAEGILVGYRWYDARDITPLYPFGHGLSYTTFQYADLHVQPQGDGFDVRFQVRNTGDRTGTEVAQIYAAPPSHPPVSMAPQSLVGFARLQLDPGEARTVTVHVSDHALSYWSTAAQAWTLPPGDRPLLVGSSSRDVRLRGTLPVPTH